MSIHSITQELAKNQASKLEKYVQFEMEKRGLTLEDLKDYEIKREDGEIKYEYNDNKELVSISQNVRYIFQKKK